jgi:hypothetical protein
VNALVFNTTGGNNVAVGFNAGFNLTTGEQQHRYRQCRRPGRRQNHPPRHPGHQTRAFIAGISGAAVSGSAVVVNGAGQLGIVVSSARYKHGIHDMGRRSSGLMKLRPVTFMYKNDPEKVRQYGLVAEEVARVYPELVSYGADGKVETVN